MSASELLDLAGGSASAIKNNYNATSLPTTTDDSSAGYGVGSQWIDTTSDTAYICVDATAGAALWAIAGAWVAALLYGDRGVFIAGGGVGVAYNTMDYIRISAPGNAANFGAFSATVSVAASASDGSRGVVAGGYSSGVRSSIDYITIATPGNSAAFGVLSAGGRYYFAGASSKSRGLFLGGNTGTTDTSDIQYVTISVASNSSTFGSLLQTRQYHASASDGSRAIVAGGYAPASAALAGAGSIEYVTIATTGNGTSFGSLSVARYYLTGASNDTFGIFFGGYTTVNSSEMDYITIATAGNATHFGNLSISRYSPTATSNNSRAVVAGGWSTSPMSNIDYVNMSTPGASSTFGALSVARREATSVSGT